MGIFIVRRDLRADLYQWRIRKQLLSMVCTLLRARLSPPTNNYLFIYFFIRKLCNFHAVALLLHALFAVVFFTLAAIHINRR